MARAARSPAHAGFTMIEMLVVILILGILALLLIPAVMNARESARRLECLNRLKQIGSALHAHQSAHGTFPVPMPVRSYDRRPGGGFGGSESLSGFYELLPMLELSTLYHSINAGYVDAEGLHEFSPLCLANQTAYETYVVTFLCPSDTVRPIDPGSPNSYRFNVGSADPPVNITHRPQAAAGAFETMVPRSPAVFTDGLAMTAGFGERLIGGGPGASWNPKRDLWMANVLHLIDPSIDDETLGVCRSLTHAPGSFTTEMGQSWMFAGPYYVWYNHVAPPNERWADCATGDKNRENARYCITCSIALRSLHGGGVHCLFMDGSVHFVRDGINLAVWRALGTRAGGESVGTVDW